MTDFDAISREIAGYRRALKSARGWLAMLAQERPETSDIHTVLASVDAALAAQAIEARSGETEGLDPKDESAVGEVHAPKEEG